jgi:cytochrome c oxidase accessory protein FixG
MSPHRITFKRQSVQALLIAAALLLPFVTVAGNPFLRMDIGLRTLFMAGIPVRVDQFYLVLLATLFVIAAFLFLTAVLGRVWCGWLCPQTVFNDLAELSGGYFRKSGSHLVSALMEHLCAILISKTIAFNLLCWFMSPYQVVTRLLHFQEFPLLFTTFMLLTLFGYLNLIIVKRSFCRSYCPYGRFQTALMDSGTLNLAFLEETRHRCLRCGACVKTCPMDIDIRNGFQIECIGCGRCIDACRDIMETQPCQNGLIDYRFGEEQGGRARFGRKALSLCALSLLLGVALVWGLIGRNQDAFAVQRIASVESRLMPDGFQIQPWRATLGNRSESIKIYSIRIKSSEADEISLLGPVSDIRIQPNEHREVTFMVRHKRSGSSPVSAQLELVRDNQVVVGVQIRP